MDILTSLIFLAVGAGAGFGVAKMLSRKSTADIEARVRAEGEAERVRLATEMEALGRRAQEYVAESRKKDERLDAMAAKLTGLERREAELIATLQSEKDATEEKLSLLSNAKAKLEETFTALSRKALDQNSESFVNYAKSVLDGYQKSAQADLQQRQERIADLVEPVKKSLDNVDDRIQQLEQERAKSYGALREQVEQMSTTQKQLHVETNNLVKALRSSNTRGQWGELQLKRIVELANMTNYCDFQEQVSAEAEEGKHRPDMIINLPSGRTIVVDAKAPMSSFLDAHEAADDAARKDCYVRHAQQLRTHIGILSQKAYWNSFASSPEFVLLFLPNEALFSVALEHDSRLIEDGAANNVIIATPTTLIALLKAASYGWKQEAMGQEVEQVAAEGRKLYKRLAKLTDHIVMLGGSLNKSVKAYNSMLGSLEHSVLPSARRMGKKLRVTSAGEGVIKEVPPIELAAGEVQAPELLRRDDEPITPDDIEAIDGDEPVEDDVPAMPQVASAKIAR